MAKSVRMDVRVGDEAQKEKTLKIVRAAGMDVRITLEGAHIQAFDGDVLVVAIMRVREGVFAFRYHPAYWNGL
jgi:hypothetical protein